MTDEQMDARLRRAGAAWREASGPVATAEVVPQVETLTAPAARKPHRPRRTGLLASAAVVAAAIVAGGAFLVANIGSDDGGPSPVDAGPTSLTGTTWKLVHITDANGHDVPVAGKAALSIDESDHLSGSDGCNSISGDVDVNATMIGFGNGLATTELACPNQMSATAEHVDALLAGDVAWRINDDELTLSKAGAGTLVYQAVRDEVTSTDPKDVIGVTWNLTTIETGSIAQQVTGSPTLHIDRAETLGFTDGCNSNSGKVSVGAGTIDIANVGGTEAYCKQSNEVMAVLTGHVTWVIEGDQLTITKDGVGALIYARSGASKIELAKLVGHAWTLISAPDIVVTFENGHVTIKHRCYANKGDAQIGESTLDISHVTLESAIPCISPTDPNEDQTNSTVDEVLSGSVQWQIKDGQLQITKGRTTLDFASSAQQQSQLTGTLWKLIDNTAITLTINDNGTFRLQTICDVDGGTASVSGGAVTFADRHVVEPRKCPAPTDQARLDQSAVDHVLKGVAKWSIADGQLTLGNAAGTLRFSAS